MVSISILKSDGEFVYNCPGVRREEEEEGQIISREVLTHEVKKIFVKKIYIIHEVILSRVVRAGLLSLL